jgi:hypothetical protein
MNPFIKIEKLAATFNLKKRYSYGVPRMSKRGRKKSHAIWLLQQT